MINGSLARRYSQALFKIATETALDPIDTDLRELTKLVEGNKEVNNALLHPHISSSDKKSIMDKILGEEFGETTRRFLHLLIDRKREYLLPVIQREFTRLADEARQVVEAKVVSAISLDDSQLDNLKKAIGRMTGKDVRIISEVRSELIGGVLIQVGDRVMDGTVAHALNRMREDLRKTSDKPQEVGVK
ncbi:MULTISPECIES: ATP synthase F1 subunit delta [Desulfosporosinus]|uniref:ATP synthase subunit delta n=1 Tax=Desulfosporosinus lacus DSM 15449 TaxID=1121420 RepID=A0A1M5R3R2_9FIRM|nr:MULTISPECIES: ATP synthase F1 subunit delta [Desulfosporosinus]MDA8220481.1 ATP synthase F1 subunit delta [Desulfitobacterium hafniense]MCB8816238.1 ATP synthase F1 subunit delta [Desulfosporosinus sp. SRJS8]MCO1601523.1 ATP synthase F1 subunit delta [Desulfosporosinus nitroreducens]MCO5386148.1 ATP synthase F1 subunit delta [Desulfosporosinus sp.]SHH20841.1 F-type H+-transporting ATPase subunit delta [Desulfosporosinus lacus DSM 15449]